jgi:FkbM family methyltransferase
MSSKFGYWVDRFAIQSAPLIHIGAHLVQEKDEYSNLNFTPVLWFEGIPEIAGQAQILLDGYPDQKIINSALWSEAGISKIFHYAGHEGSSSSLLTPFLITASHPEVRKTNEFLVVTSTLDIELGNLGENTRYKILVLDVQGAEIEVLKGCKQTLENIDYIISEISQIELYKNDAQVGELASLLCDLGYIFVASEMNRATGWGEGLFIHQRALNGITKRDFEHITVGKRFAKGRIARSLFLKAKQIRDVKNLEDR